MARRGNKWIWRRYGGPSLGVHSVCNAHARSDAVEGAPPATQTAPTIEEEAARVLWEWQELQDVLEGIRAEANRRQEEPFVAFGWEELGAIGEEWGMSGWMEVDGVRHRLRGRGEV